MTGDRSVMSYYNTLCGFCIPQRDGPCNAIIKTEENKLVFGCKNTIIPNSVMTIGAYAFLRCSGLTSITIPSSVTSIEAWAFAHCSNLTSVTLMNNNILRDYQVLKGMHSQVVVD